MSKLKATAKGAWAKARKVDAKPRGGGGFPPNLKGLVAACQTYKFAETNTPAKDPYFQLTCIVKDPDEFVGRRATFMWFINESEYATVEDNLNQLSNDLQLLNEEMPEDVTDVVGILASLCERGVHLLFKTGQPRKNGRPPNLFIEGLAEDWPDEPQEGAGEAEARPAGRSTAKPAKEKEPADEPEADADAESAESNGEATTEEWEPAKGDQYYFTPPKGKKTLCEVIAVDGKKKTVDLKTTTKPSKKFPGVKWWKDKAETESNLEGE